MATSYDTLLKQVETLTAENSNLKKELKDNSNQLCQLETEASSMKDALLQLHYSTQSMQEDIMAAHRTSEVKVTMRGSQSVTRVRNLPVSEVNHAPPEGYVLLEELEKERFILSQQQENEEKLKAWYMNHLQDLKRRLEELPLSEHQYPMSLARQQIELEMKQLRDVMQKSLGCPEEVQTRQRKRAIRLHSIDQKLKDMYARKQEAKAEDKRVSHHGRGHTESRHHHHHQQGAPPNGHHNPPSHAANHSQGPGGRTASPYRHLSSDGRPPGVQVAWGPGQGSPPEGGEPKDQEQETSSLVSFNSSNGSDRDRKAPAPQFGTKVEMVYSLLSMLGTHDKDDMSRTLLAMSSSQDSCISMRESGCLPLLIQLLHGPEREFLLGLPREGQEARSRASTALHNIVHSHPDEAKRKQESRILRLLEQIRAYCDDLMERNSNDHEQGVADHNPGQAIATLMKHSFDEEYRCAICQLGGIQAIAELLQIDYELNSDSNEQYVVTLRRYAGMAITNLTFGDVTNKALLCSMKGCMRALVAQLKHQNEDLRQVAASVLRNLSWRADMASKRILRDVGAVPALMRCALEVEKESSLKSVLSALWNLSAHCTENKADICSVEGSLNFMVGTLTYKSPTRNWAVVENGGGILRNVSSHIATNEEYRKILRDNNCLQILLRHLKSSSLTIVSNACGTLWNLSARNKDDQDLLWELGAVSMLKNLVHSKHKMIAMGSSAALRNLMSARPDLLAGENQKDGQPSLHVRKQRALEAEIDKNLRDSHLEGVIGERKRYSYSYPRLGGGRGDSFPSSRTMPSMQGKPDHSPVPQRIPIWSQNAISVPEPEKMSSPLLKRHQTQSGQRENMSSTSSPGVPYQPYGINLQPGKGSPAKKMADDRGAAVGSPATSRIAKVMQDVQQHSTASLDGSQSSKPSTTSYGSPGTSIKEPLKTVPAHCLMKGNHSSLTSRSNSYSFGIEGDHTDLNHRASQESIHSDIYPSASHERALKWTKDQERTHSDENGLNRESNKKSHLVEHKAVVHQSGVEDIGQEADSIINFSLKYSEEDLHPPRQGRKPLEEGESDEPENKGQSSDIPQDWCNNKYGKPSSVDRGATGNRFETISTNLPNVHCINFTEDTDDFFRDDKPTNFADRYEEEEGEEHEEPPLDSGKIPSAEGGEQKQRVHEDGMKSYYVEDTPVVFSRCSSLSSLEDDENVKEGTDGQVKGGQNGGDGSQSPKDQPPTSHTPDAERHTEEPECHVEDTPLIFSRCSSVSSLSSVEVQDICEDKSSICSDSRRASEVVSPSDLPDSPSETMPQSPKRTKALRPVPTEQLPSRPNLPGNEEKVVSYRQVEGQTVDNSCATSLSALTIDDETKVAPVKVMEDDDPEVDGAEPPGDEAEKELSDTEQSLKEQEEDILNACINSALPSKKTGKSKSKSKLGNLRKNGRGSLPTLVGREPDGAMDVISAYKTEDTPINFSTSTSLSDLTIEDIDIVKTEDGSHLRVQNPTKSNSSAKPVPTSQNREQDGLDKAGDDSLLEACINSAMPKSKIGRGKSGIPKKNRGIPKLKGSKASGSSRKRNQVSELRYKSPSPIPEMAHENRAASEIQEEEWPGTVSPAPDTVQTFCVEGTPGLSKASSWGDLTESLVQEDILNGNAPQVQEVRRSSFAGAGAGVKKPKSNGRGLLGTTSKLSSGSTALDSPIVYGMEGTPASFSRNDSLSSLSCDEDADLSQEKSDMGNTPSSRKQGDGATSQDLAGMSSIPPASSSQPQSFYDTPMDSPRVFMVEGTPLSFSRKESLSSISCDEDDERDQRATSKTAKECLAEKTRETGESPKEKKEPGALGREFLQRQLNSEDPFENFKDDKEEDDDLEREDDVFETPTDPEQEQAKETTQKTQREQIRPFAVEDTPVCFSRNSSLSSLSINSDDEDDEQALLEQCISSGMPQGKKEKTFHIESGTREKRAESEGRALNRTYNKDDLKAAKKEYQAEEQEQEETKVHRGPRISKPSGGDQKAPEAPKGVRGGKKTYRSPITGQTRTVTQVKTIVTRGRGTVLVKSVGRGTPPQARPTTPAGRGSPPGKPGRGGGSGRGGSGRGGRTGTPPRTITPPRSSSTPPKTTTPPRSTSGSRTASPGGGVPRLGVKRGSISSVSDTSSNNGTGKTSPAGRSISLAGRGRTTNIKTTPARNFGSTAKGRGSSPSWNASTTPVKPPLGRGKKPVNGSSISAPGSRTQSPATGRTQSPAARKTQIPTGRKTSTTSSPSPIARTQIPARRGSGSPGTTRIPSAAKSSQSSTTRTTASPSAKSTPGGPKRGGIPTLRSKSTPPVGKLSPPKKKSPPASDRASESESQGECSPPQSPPGNGEQADEDPPKLQKQSTFTREKPSLPDHTPEMSSTKSVGNKKPDRKAEKEKLDDILSETGSDLTSHSSGSMSNGGWRRTRTGSNTNATSPPNKSANNAAKGKTPIVRGANGTNGKNTPTSKAVNARTASVPNRTPQTRRVASPSPKPQGRNSSSPAKPSQQNNNLKARDNNNSRRASPAPGIRKTSPAVRKTSTGVQKPSSAARQTSPTAGQPANVFTTGGLQRSPVESRAPMGNSGADKEKGDICKVIGIPIQNKKGKVKSPSNDAIRNSGVWVRNDDDSSPSSISESTVSMSRQSSVASVKSTTTAQVGRGDSISTRNLPNLDVLMSTRSSSVQEVSSPSEVNADENRGAESDKQRAKSLVVDRQNSETSLGGKEEKKKKRFSFLKLKVGKKKKDGEEKVKEPKAHKVKEPKEKSRKKLFKKSKEKPKQTEDSETQTDNEENICADTDQPESIDDSSQSGTLERSSYHGPDLNFDRRLDHLEDWNSDNDITNELMPDEFMDWDSEMDISKEEIPVFSETASEADPQSLEYRANMSSPQHKAKLNSDCPPASLGAQLGDYLSEDSMRNQVRAESQMIAKGLRSLSLSESVSDSQCEPAPPRPQRLRLPKKPFGMNRSDSSPTSTAIPVLVSPFNYSPKKLQLKPSEDKVHRDTGSVGSSSEGGLTQDCC